MIARFREGLGRVRRAPALVIGVWLTTLALALGPALMLRSVIDNLSRLADHKSLPPALAGIVAAQVLVSIFLAGGLLDRLARDRAIGAAAFFSACGLWAGRFARLA